MILLTVPLLINSDDETLTVADPKFTSPETDVSVVMSVVFDSVVVDINIDIPVFVDSETGVVTVADLIDVSVLEGIVFVEMPNV